VKAAVTTKYSQIHDETCSPVLAGSKLKKEVLKRVLRLSIDANGGMKQDQGLTYSSECARESDQSDNGHRPHVDSVTPRTQRQSFGLGGKLFHEDPVSLCCFGDLLRGYGRSVIEVVVSM
jgi:hypothetical protein